MKWLLVVAAIGSAGWYGYELGASLTRSELVRLKSEVEQLHAERLENDQLRAEARSAIAVEQAKAAECEERYAHDVPTPDLLDVLRLVRQRQADGLSPERLQTIITGATAKQVCERPSPTRSILVSVDPARPVRPWVVPEENEIKLRVIAAAATPSSSRSRPVFDSRQPVTIRASRVGAEDEEVTGTLPLSWSTVHDRHEYQFEFSAGKRSSIAVVVRRCQYP